MYPTGRPLGTSRSRSRGDDDGHDDNQEEEEDLFLVLVVATGIASFTGKRDTMKYVWVSGNIITRQFFTRHMCVVPIPTFKHVTCPHEKD